MGEGQENAWVRQLAEMLACEIMKKMSGIRLERRSPPDSQKEAGIAMDAVCGMVEGGYRMGLRLRAEPRMFLRLARNMIEEEPEDEEEIQDYAVEFFNVLCGRFVSELYQATELRAHLRPPWYAKGPGEDSLVREGPLDILYFITEEEELVEFSWTKQPIEQLLKRSRAL